MSAPQTSRKGILGTSVRTTWGSTQMDRVKERCIECLMTGNSCKSTWTCDLPHLRRRQHIISIFKFESADACACWSSLIISGKHFKYIVWVVLILNFCHINTNLFMQVIISCSLVWNTMEYEIEPSGCWIWVDKNPGLKRNSVFELWDKLCSSSSTFATITSLSLKRIGDDVVNINRYIVTVPSNSVTT